MLFICIKKEEKSKCQANLPISIMVGNQNAWDNEIARSYTDQYTVNFPLILERDD